MDGDCGAFWGFLQKFFSMFERAYRVWPIDGVVAVSGRDRDRRNPVCTRRQSLRQQRIAHCVNFARALL